MKHRIIWISAPAGAGKTSLGANYAETRKRPVLWYQVDRGDGDIATFFYYLGLAAQRAAPRYRTPLPLLTPEYLGDVPTFTRNFFRELFRRLPRRTVLVLDNYHEAPEEPPLHEILRLATEEMPDGLNLIVLSRSELPAVLSRARLENHAVSLDWEALQLTLEETEGISALHFGDRPIDREVLIQLHGRAGGWAAGVVLMLEQAQGSDLSKGHFAADRGLLFDYFAGEVLTRSDAETHAFLLQTSLFPKVSVTAAQALTGNDRAGEILEGLARRNYFTVRHRDTNGDTYQYHPLFVEFLQKSAEREYGSETISRLREQAGKILIDSGQLSEGIESLIAAKAWPLLAERLRQHAPPELRHGRWLTVNQWLASLPRDQVEADPWLVLWRAHSVMPRDLYGAREDYRNAYLRFKALREPVGTFLAWSGAVDTFMYAWGGFAPLDYWLDEMAELHAMFPVYPSLEIEARVTCGMIGAGLWRRPNADFMEKWGGATLALLVKPVEVQIKLMAGFLLLLYLMWWKGDLARARMVFSQLRPLGEDPHIGVLARLLWKVSESAHLVMVGDPDSSIRAADEGLALAGASGVHHLDMLLYAQLAYASLSKFDVDGAHRALCGMETLMAFPAAFDYTHYHYLRCWTLLCEDRKAEALDEIHKAVATMGAAGASNYPYFGAVTLAQALYEGGRTEEALATLEPVLEWDQRVGGVLMQVNYHLVHAQRALDSEDYDACGRALTIALEKGESQGLPLIPWFGFRGPLLARLLHFALTRGIQPGYARRLIRLRRLSPPDGITVTDAWPFPAKIRVLGEFSLVVNEQPVARAAAHKRPLELLQALAAKGGRGIDGNDLAEALWPEAEGDDAHRNLKINVHRLRKLLPEGALIWSDGKLSLDQHQTWLDLWSLERELARLEEAAAHGSDRQLPLVEEILRLYGGGFLERHNTAWALAARERLRGKTLRIVSRAADAVGQRDPATAVPIYEHAIEIDPLRESLYQGLLRCHIRLGQRAEGVQAYQRCRDVLQRELGIDPAPATKALYLSLKADH